MTCTGGRLAASTKMDDQLSVPRDVCRSVFRSGEVATRPGTRRTGSAVVNRTPLPNEYRGRRTNFWAREVTPPKIPDLNQPPPEFSPGASSPVPAIAACRKIDEIQIPMCEKEDEREPVQSGCSLRSVASLAGRVILDDAAISAAWVRPLNISANGLPPISHSS